MRDPKGPTKPYKSPEELAKKHNISLDKINKQVESGTKVEGEHTTSKSAARITALQHIDELPDYYSRLKKVEKTVKKEGVGEQKYCRLCRKYETMDECSYGPKMWEKYTKEPLSINQIKYNVATVHPGDMPEGFNHQIDSHKFKEIKRKEKIRNLVTRGSTEGERAVAKNKLGKTTELPKLNKESISIEDANGNTFAEIIDIIVPEKLVSFSSKKQLEEKIGLWDRIHARREKGLPRKKPGEKGYPKTLDIKEGIEQARKNVGASKCWKNKKLGNPPTKMKGGKEVPNCVSEKYSDWRRDLGEDWQSANRKDGVDGLSQSTVDKYRKENPGSKLQTAVTTPPSKLKKGSADWKRRKNFCSRSQSWDGEAGRAARRRWNCN
jgi:hypothetical protein